MKPFVRPDGSDCPECLVALLKIKNDLTVEQFIGRWAKEQHILYRKKEIVQEPKVFLVDVNGSGNWKKIEAATMEIAAASVTNIRVNNVRIIDEELVAVFVPTSPLLVRVR